MTEYSNRYRKLADQFESKLAAVPEDAWTRQSKNPEWTTRDIPRHVIESSSSFLKKVDVEGRALPDEDLQLLNIFRQLKETVCTTLETPELATRKVDGLGPPSPWQESVDSFLCVDLVVHAWDLARAAGIDDTLDIETVHIARERAEAMVETGRKYGAFGPEVDVSDDANEQDKLMALLGRTP